MTPRKIRFRGNTPVLELLDQLSRLSFVFVASAPVILLLGMGTWAVCEALGVCRFVDHSDSLFARPTLALIVGVILLLAGGLSVPIARRVLAPLCMQSTTMLPGLRMLCVTFGPLWVFLFVAYGVIAVVEGRLFAAAIALPIAMLADRAWRSLEAHWPHLNCKREHIETEGPA